MRKLIILFLIISFNQVYSQVVYEHISNKNIYEFIDELASNKIIEINSVTKPYSRNLIAKKLLESKINEDQLSKRQKRELNFYLQGFQTEMDFPLSFKNDFLKKNSKWALSPNPTGVFYKDSVFTAWIKPILGYEYSTNSNGYLTHSWGGLEFGAYIGKNLSFYTSLRDNNLSRNLIKPEYFIQEQGVSAKNYGDKGIDFNEARGGIVYTWKWGNIGLIKDHIVWGNNYFGSNILSGRTPSYGMIKLQLKPVNWFEFNYFHGWLVSDVIDSTRSYWDGDVYRSVFYPKYIASNMFTVRPFKNFSFSFGNSIIYSDDNVQAVYLIPFLFYKSVDHTVSSLSNSVGNNAQMFFDVSSRNIRHLHLYGTLFIDEISLTNMFDKQKQSNLLSFKAGFKVYDFPLSNISFGFEYTRTNPMTYQHFIATTTFESNNYNLGHYLRDNSDVYNISITFKPLRGLHTSIVYSLARHGDDFIYEIETHQGLKFMENVTWKESKLLLSASYEIVNNTYVYLKYQIMNISGNQEQIDKYTSDYYQGKTNTFTLGANIGF